MCGTCFPNEWSKERPVVRIWSILSFWFLVKDDLHSIETVWRESRCLQKLYESEEGEMWTVITNMCVLILMLLFLGVGERERERGKRMCMTQSNLCWFPLHVWWYTLVSLSPPAVLLLRLTLTSTQWFALIPKTEHLKLYFVSTWIQCVSYVWSDLIYLIWFWYLHICYWAIDDSSTHL